MPSGPDVTRVTAHLPWLDLEIRRLDDGAVVLGLRVATKPWLVAAPAMLGLPWNPGPVGLLALNPYIATAMAVDMAVAWSRAARLMWAPWLSAPVTREHECGE